MLSPLSLRLHRFLSILSLGGDRDGARFQRQDLPLRHRAALWGNRRIERFQSRLIRRSDRIHVAGFSGFGVATQESDVFAFGVMMLELLSGEESLKYRYEKSTGDFERTLVIETAKAVVDGGDGGDVGGG
ncbi:unnamed protein product [Brassica rapa subsp. trilocularis]